MEREHGTPLPTQSAAGVAVIHGRITPSHTPATAGVGLAAVRVLFPVLVTPQGTDLVATPSAQM